MVPGNDVPPTQGAQIDVWRNTRDEVLVLAPKLDWRCPSALLGLALTLVHEEVRSRAPRIRREDVAPVLDRWADWADVLLDARKVDVTRSLADLARQLHGAGPRVVSVAPPAVTEPLVRGLRPLGFEVRANPSVSVPSTLEFVEVWTGAPVRAWAAALQDGDEGVVREALTWAHREVGARSTAVRHVAEALTPTVGPERHPTVEIGLALLSASWLLRGRLGDEAWTLLRDLAPKDDCPPWVAAHFHGAAATAATQAHHPDLALPHLEANLALLDRAFPPGTQREQARAGRQHDLAKALLQRPGPPDPRIRGLLEESLATHEATRRWRGASMCRTDLADLDMRLGDLDGAQAWLDEARALDEQRHPAGVPAVLHQVVRLHERRGRFEAALATVEEALDIAERTGSPSHLVQQLENTRMRILLRLGGAVVTNAAEALALLDEVGGADRRAQMTRTHTLVGQLREQQRFADAEEVAREALRRLWPAPGLDSLRVLLAGVLLDQWRHDDAFELLREPAETPRDEAGRQYQLGRALLLVDRPEEAVERLTPLCEADQPDQVRGPAACLAAQAAALLGDPVSALRLAKIALGTTSLPAPLARKAYKTGGRAAIALNERDTARDFAERHAALAARARHAEDAVEAALAWAEVHVLDGAIDAAKAALDDACARVEASPGRLSPAVVHRRAAEVLYHARLGQEALVRIERGCALADQELDEGALSLSAAGWTHRLRAHILRRQEDQAGYTAAVRRARHLALLADDARLLTAIDLLDRIDDRDTVSVPEEGPEHEALQRARDARKTGRLADAEVLALMVMERPGRPAIRRDAGLLAAAVRIQTERPEAALELLEAIERRWTGFPSDPKLAAIRAQALKALGRLAESGEVAWGALETAADLGEWFSYVRATQILTAVLREQGEHERCVELLQAAGALLRQQGWIRQAFDLEYSRVRTLLSRNRFDEAAALARALKPDVARLSPEDGVRLAYVHARRAQALGDPAAARAILQEAFSRAGVDAKHTRVNEARLLLQTIAGEAGEAPGRTEFAHGEVGRIKKLLAERRHREALETASAWVDQLGETPRPDRAIALNLLASALREERRYVEAERAARASLELHESLRMSGVPLARLGLARILLLRGDAATARRLAETARAENVEAGNIRGIEACDRLLADAGAPGMRRTTPTPGWRGALARAKEARDANDRAGEDAALEEAVSSADANLDDGGLAHALGARGLTAWHRRDLIRAEADLSRSLALHDRLGSRGRWPVAEKLVRTLDAMRAREQARALLSKMIDDRPPPEWQGAFDALAGRLLPPRSPRW